MAFVEQRMKWQFGIRTQQHSQRPLRAWTLLTVLTAVFAAWLFVRHFLAPAWLRHLPTFAQESLTLLELTGGMTLFFLWALVWWLRRQSHVVVAAPARRSVTVDELYALSPSEFEQYVARLFRQRGYRVKVRGRSGDLGVDLELRQANGKTAVVQCKRYRSTVGPEIIRELYGTLIHERAAHAFLVTTADISEAARDWVRGKPITLIDGETLVKIVGSLDR